MASKDESALQATLTAQEKFSSNLYLKLTDPSKNLVVSSLSVSSALAMILFGAKGKTAKQIEDCLYQKSDDAIAGFKGIMKTIENLKHQPETNKIILRAANKIFPEVSFNLIPN